MSPKLTLTLTLFNFVRISFARVLALMSHQKAAPQLTLTLPNLFRINSVQTSLTLTLSSVRI